MTERLKNRRLNTKLVQAALGTDPAFNSIVPPIYPAVNYRFESLGDKPPIDYSRIGNPTRDALGKALADIEGGHDAVITSSGMAAQDLLFQLLGPEDLIIAPFDCYGGTYRLLEAKAEKNHFKVRFVDQTDSEALEQAFNEKPRMVFIETPTNPLLRIVDLEFVSGLAKKAGALMVVDNTFASPVLQRPIEFGADMVIHSTTKYLNGHSDVVGGALITTTAEHQEELLEWTNNIGYTPSAIDCFLTLRGMRTLDVRMQRQQENTARIVELLKDHPAVGRIYYPGLPDHPGHELAKKQQAGFGAIVSFELEGDVRTFCEALEIFFLAESLGGVESLVDHPASMTHECLSDDAKKTAGISEQLIRLSVGIEDGDDLLEDLKQGLDKAKA